ncbi:MAG: metallophosphoesterase family protein [Minicystis sp.]
MITFHADPQIAEQQMHAVIFTLTSFGYIDGDFDKAEKRYIRDYIGKLVVERARTAMGDNLGAHYGLVERWIQHFHEVLDETEQHIADLFTESVADGESTVQFVVAKLKLRCFELFRHFDEKTRAELLATVDELMAANGVIAPSEQLFLLDLRKLLLEPVELADAEIEAIEAGALLIGPPVELSPAQPDHPFFKGSERPFAKDPETFAQEAAGDMDSIRRVTEALAAQRARGEGRLAAAGDLAAIPAGSSFLDGHVYVRKPAPGKPHELLVIGDLHGCYSCLKAALLQADFFKKVQAYHDDPAANPEVSLVLLGDYIDRGRYSYNGVLRTAMQLFATVPDHVYLLRGNHEYYVEINGRVLAPVRPSEALNELQGVAKTEVLATYMRLFEALPNMLVFDRTLFVHAGIPRDDTIAERWKGLASLNDPEIRFQMLWSDPSEVEVVPPELQKANARFPFGKKQLKSFLSRLGLSTLVRGHERVVEGFKLVYDDEDARLITLFSAGGKTNEDLPPTSNYRDVTPMALTLRHKDEITEIAPFAIDYARYNQPEYNAFFRARIEGAR